MQFRQYIVKMPNEVATTALDILVETSPGTSAAAITAGGDGAYYELLGRPIRFETESGDTGFLPRLSLGFLLSITPINAAGQVDTPGVQLSASLASLASTDSKVPVPAFADPGGVPAIRLVGTANTAGKYFAVTLGIATALDSDRSARGQ